MENRLFIRKVMGSYILHKLEDNVLTILGDSQHTIGGIEPFYKISHKNCDAIVNGYDLDKLSEKACSSLMIYKDDTDGIPKKSLEYSLARYKQGFNKALILKKDKMFTLEDMQKAIAFGFDYEGLSEKEISEKYNFKIESYNSYSSDSEKFINSLYPREWDVEILTDICGDKVYAVPEYVLDADGCIILTLKK
jgi:hypothetical protein